MTKQELEEKLEQTEKALADYQFNYPSIKELEQENAALKNEIVNLKGVIESLSEQRDGLEKEKCELLGIIQGKDKTIKDMQDNYDGYKAVAEPEIERLKKECGKVQDWTSEYYELENLMNNKVAEAKEIIKGLLCLKSTISSAQDAENRFSVREKAEEFLKECE
jgi:predicted  nucleic acid-binding Zn-ribbon protein